MREQPRAAKGLCPKADIDPRAAALAPTLAAGVGPVGPVGVACPRTGVKRERERERGVMAVVQGGREIARGRSRVR